MDAPSLFAGLNLHTRPPTPPKDSNDHKEMCDSALAMLSSNLLPRPLDTPHESPESSTEHFIKSSGRGTKRVSFISTPNNIEDLENIGSTPASEKSSAGLRPIRSILKRSGSLLASDPLSSDPAPLDDRDFPTMLEEMMRGLASPDVSARFDAYMVINGCLKTYKDLPSRQALVEKLPLLTGFIQRDLSEVKSTESPRASQLVAEAVRLTTTLLWSDPTKNTLSHGFQSFILNHAVSATASLGTSKNLLNQYLFLLSTQDFGPKVMTKEKANRLLTGLQGIEERFKSKSVTANKVAIYKKMLRQEQARLVMTARASDWMDHLFSCLLSAVKEIRVRAIDFGLSAGRDVGTEHQVSKAFRDLFSKTASGEDAGKGYAQAVIDRLAAWAESKEHATHVSQIWSVGVMFLRNKERPFDKWKYAGPWLKVLQKCFNSSDLKVKSQANQAWTRLICAISPDASTSPSTSSLLLAPLESQMGRFKSFSKETREGRRITYAAYGTLLYYAFRPGVDFQTTERYWKEFVHPVMTRTQPRPLIEPEIISRTLVALLNTNSTPVWDADRISKAAMLKPEELPSLDVKWLRSRAHLVFQLVDSLIEQDYWWDPENGELFLQVWQNLTKAISYAGSKEVKTSTETMAAVAEILTRLHRLAERPSFAEDDGQTSQRFAMLMRTAVDNIGLVAFTEKRLVHESWRGFQVSDVITGISKGTQQPISPLFHLFDILVNRKVRPTLASYEATLQALLDIFLAVSASPLSKVNSLGELTGHLASKPGEFPSSKVVLWDAIAERLQDVLNESESESADGRRGHTLLLAKAVNILKLGARLSRFGGWRTWYTLLDILDGEAQNTVGLIGSVRYVIEPLADFFLSEFAPKLQKSLEPICSVVDKVIWPAFQKDEVLAQRKLYGSHRGIQSASLAYFKHLYPLCSRLLSAAYKSSAVSTDLRYRTLNAIKRLVERCPPSFAVFLLLQAREGFESWVTDPDQVLNTSNLDSQTLFKEVVEVWAAFLKKFRTLVRFDTALLSNMEPLIVGFTSRHKAIVNQSIIFWNSTFGRAKHLEYPQLLRAALYKLSFHAELQLPSLCVEENDSEAQSTPIEFADTPEYLGRQVQNPELLVKESTHRIPLNDFTNTIAEMVSSAPMKTPEPSPLSKRKNPSERATPRLRHDNSQIEFAAIDSSPSILGAIDSRLLTDRQKEVRERQNREAAALFPDLRSSPKSAPSTRKEATPRLQLSQRDMVEASGGSKELVSPTLPTTDNMTHFLGSSPTPSQRSSSSRAKPLTRLAQVSSPHSEIQLVGPDLQVPSSPPSVAVGELPEVLIENSERMEGLEPIHVEDSQENPQITGHTVIEDAEVLEDEVEKNTIDKYKHIFAAGPEKNMESEEELGRSFVDALTEGAEEAEWKQEMPDKHDDIVKTEPRTANPNSTEKGSGVNGDKVEHQTASELFVTAPNPNEAAADILLTDGPSNLSSAYLEVPDSGNKETEKYSLHRATPEHPSINDLCDLDNAVEEYASDHNDLVSSQIARELESASQDTTVYNSPIAMVSQASSTKPKGNRPRGRPKRKRETPAEEVIEDTIIVAQLDNLPPQTAQQGSPASVHGSTGPRERAHTETKESFTSEAEPGISRPKKKSRRSSKVEAISGSQSSPEHERHRRSSQHSKSSPGIRVRASQRSDEATVGDSFVSKHIAKGRCTATALMETRGELAPNNAAERRREGGPSEEATRAAPEPGSKPSGEPSRASGDNSGLVSTLEAAMEMAKRGVPAEDSVSFMRLSMQLMEIAMKSMGK